MAKTCDYEFCLVWPFFCIRSTMTHYSFLCEVHHENYVSRSHNKGFLPLFRLTLYRDFEIPLRSQPVQNGGTFLCGDHDQDIRPKSMKLECGCFVEIKWPYYFNLLSQVMESLNVVSPPVSAYKETVTLEIWNKTDKHKLWTYIVLTIFSF